MSAKWPVVRLGDYVDSSLGKMLDKVKNKGNDHPYLGNSDVRWGYFDLSDLSQMKFEESESDRYGIKHGDLIVCEGGEPGRCAIWKEDVPDMKIQKALHRVRPKPTLNNYYLYYWFLFSGSRGLLEPYFTGTTIKHLTGKALKNLEIQLPPLDYQEYVAKVLKSLDDKIELNRQTNQTLEQIAQAIFKSWFVDFEPTRAKIAAKQIAQARQDSERSAALKAALFADDRWPEAVAAAIAEGDPERAAMAAISGKSLDELDHLSPEQQTQLLTTAALFPDALVDSELGEIPEGWSINFLYDVAEIVYGKNLPTKDLLEYGYPVFGGNGVIGFHERYLYEDPMTLVSCRGAASGKVLRSLPKSFVTNNSLVIDHGKKGYLTQYYLEPCLNRYGLTELTSGSAQPQMTIANMSPVQLVVPTKEIINNHKDLVGPLFNKILQQETEVKRLESLRDTLLPKLLSGELDIRANQTELDKTA